MELLLSHQVVNAKNNIYNQYAEVARCKMVHIVKSMIGEALIGDGAEVAHIDLVIGPKGSAVETAFMNSLAMPRKGHTPLLAVLEPNLQPKPSTLIINKVTIKNADQAVLMFGPAQAAVAKAVVDCVDEGTINRSDADDLLLIVSVFIHWEAKDKQKIYDYNYEATKLAIERAVRREPAVEEVLKRKDKAKHPFA
jgi:5,6,7,8-tetrahydromethanopterin hydro-lyase